MALLNSFAADYLVRQKLAGKHLTFFILKQVAIPPPARLKERCPWAGAETYLDFLARRTLELVYTADDLHALREDQAALPGPFVWDRARRSVIRAEMDASIFHLYGLGPEDVEYIMSTFPVAESYEVKRDGEFTTKRLILERYAAMDAAAGCGDIYSTPLDPPPGQPAAAYSTEEVRA